MRETTELHPQSQVEKGPGKKVRGHLRAVDSIAEHLGAIETVLDALCHVELPGFRGLLVWKCRGGLYCAGPIVRPTAHHHQYHMISSKLFGETLSP